ncbi:hypothetical protein PR048_032285 [Dryococelus australis]|uniref:G protein-coupled receptor n=1 Tax=Dryococelus australis TaxID=614101 RepID=A0ABQ9G4U1_9NEOP|nr:hypothetical protein PR048_032285 [Dryococelus australis]
MWHQHDGCPAHNAVCARRVLDQKYPGRWTGCGRPVQGAARSPDLNPLNFFLWGYLKGDVYRDIPTTPENMQGRIVRAYNTLQQATLGESVVSFIKRLNLCIASYDHHFEHIISIFYLSHHVSGISLMGVPSEIYTYGTQYYIVNLAILITGVLNYYIYLPVFFELQLTSTYEYLELRFNQHVRVMASLLFTISVILYIPIVIYVPALAFNQAKHGVLKLPPHARLRRAAVYQLVHMSVPLCAVVLLRNFCSSWTAVRFERRSRGGGQKCSRYHVIFFAHRPRRVGIAAPPAFQSE